MDPALSLRGLTKRYDDGTLALDDLDLDVPAGSFFGLLGPNGAGKTTLISAVCNLIRPTEGELKVFGHPSDCLEARRLIGISEQEPNLDRFLSVRETLVYHGGYYGLDKQAAEERADEMIDVFDLRAKRDTRAPKLSGGMKRRLLLARALLHEPRLVILDEPTAGRRRRAAPRALELHPKAPRAGHDDRPHHPLPRRGRGALRGDRSDRRREDRRPRHGPGPDGALRRRQPRAGLSQDRRRRPTAARGGRSVSGATVPATAEARPWRSLYWLCRRECHRVVKLWTQTALAPVVSSLLFIVVFGLSLGARISEVQGFDYEVFIVPGLIAMAMAQAAYSNNASTIYQGRSDRFIDDVLAAPMYPWQMNFGFLVGGAFRALLIGGAITAVAVPVTGAPVEHPPSSSSPSSSWSRASAPWARSSASTPNPSTTPPSSTTS